jgi:argininosuccinate lyase
LTLQDYQSIHAGIDNRVFDVLGVQRSVESRTSFGGTAPVRVREQVLIWQEKLACPCVALF